MRFLKLFSDPRRLVWNLKRECVEHMYRDKLRELAELIDREQYVDAMQYAKRLRRKNRYLASELTRHESLIDFVTDGNYERL